MGVTLSPASYLYMYQLYASIVCICRLLGFICMFSMAEGDLLIATVMEFTFTEKNL